MRAALVQLSLMMMMITVIKLTSSHSTYVAIQQDCDVSNRESNEHVLSQLVKNVSQMARTAVSKLQSDVTELKTDVYELKTGGRQKDATGKLMC